MKKLSLIGALLAALLIAVVGVSAMLSGPAALPPQPIAFNHKLHLEGVQGITCQDCHQFVANETYAGIPSKFVCFECHDPSGDPNDSSADASKEKFATLMAFAKSDGDIPWHRVTTTREDVFFSHRRHVSVAKIDCRECHPEIPDRNTPLTHGPIQMSMDACIKCHEESKSSVDCVSCHL